jgi:hypothetical protein
MVVGGLSCVSTVISKGKNLQTVGITQTSSWIKFLIHWNANTLSNSRMFSEKGLHLKQMILFISFTSLTVDSNRDMVFKQKSIVCITFIYLSCNKYHSLKPSRNKHGLT